MPGQGLAVPLLGLPRADPGHPGTCLHLSGDSKHRFQMCHWPSAQSLLPSPPRSGLGPLSRDLHPQSLVYFPHLSASQERKKTLLSLVLKPGISDQCSASHGADGNSLTLQCTWPVSRFNSFWRCHIFKVNHRHICNITYSAYYVI